MADLGFASYLQGPLGEAIVAAENMGTLPPAVFTPSVALTGPGAGPPVTGPQMHLLGPGHVAGLAEGTVVRTDPPAGAVEVEPNYMAAAEVVPPELPWVLTPARAEGGRLRPWFVLVVLEEDKAPLGQGPPLTVEAVVRELPDLRDSWGWAHVQRASGAGALPGGGTAAAATVARLVCPRRLEENVSYRACLVPAFRSKVDGGAGPHAPAWDVDGGEERVTLPVYHQWTFTTGPDGDFEDLVTRLEAADPKALAVSSVRPVDIRSPWPSEPLAPAAQLLGVQGALVPLTTPPAPDPAAEEATVKEFERRIHAHLDAPAERLRKGGEKAGDGALAPPLYGGRHVNQDHVEGDPGWLSQLNSSVANRIAAGLGADYVRAHQEELMARAWEQVGAIREANRRRATVELTTAVAERAHARHVATLRPGELLALAAPAGTRTRTSAETTLAMETGASRMVDGIDSAAFHRRLRPAGKLARQSGVAVAALIPRALAGEVTIPAGASVVPPTAAVVPGSVEVFTRAATVQLVALQALARVAAVNDPGAGGAELTEHLRSGLGTELLTALSTGSFSLVAPQIAAQAEAIGELTQGVMVELKPDRAGFGSVSAAGVKIADSAIAARVVAALQPGDSHRERLASQVRLPADLAPAGPDDPVMACPQFPLPTALTLLESDPEWLIPGLGKLPPNRVALLHQNSAFIESFLAGLNHETMRELLWREYPTDRRGTAFARFWPRPDGSPDIAPIHTWSGGALGDHLKQARGLAVLLVRGDVVRRYPDMVVTAVRALEPGKDEERYRPNLEQPPKEPLFPIEIDESTRAYAFEIEDAELKEAARPGAPGWFFIFAEHGYRIRFGFDEPPEPGEGTRFDTWSDAAWPPADGRQDPAFAPVRRGHAVAGDAFGPPPGLGPQAPRWNRDAADVARIALQRPFRVAIQADLLLQPKAEPGG